jgi:capsular polysaccharide biosynthesis protein
MKEEISLREIIEIMLKQKWVIIITTISFMLISGIVSLFLIDPTYETYSIVRMEGTANGDQKSTANIQVFEESIKSSSTLNSIIEKNQLDPQVYTISRIRKMLNVEVLKDTNAMKLQVKGSDAKEITQLANMLAFELGVRIEITDRTKDIVDTQKALDNLTDKIAIAEVKLKEAQTQLKNTPEKLTTKQVLADNDLLQSVVRDEYNKKTTDTAAIELESETVNPVYSELQSQVAQATIEVQTMRKEEENLKQKIELNQSRISEIETKSSNDKLDANKSIRILDDTNAIFINPAIQPEDPVGPKVLVNIAIAAVLGIMLSLLYVFFREYMKGTPGSEGNV